jgi:hypothetical protein
MIKLTDDELRAVLAAAPPIDPKYREAFLQRVAAELKDCGIIGPGVVHRAVKVAQKAFYDAPLE